MTISFRCGDNHSIFNNLTNDNQVNDSAIDHFRNRDAAAVAATIVTANANEKK